MDRLAQLEAFVHVAELSSFSAASRELGCAQSQISRGVRALERALGSPLFTRSTRRVVLTQEGQRYLAGARQAIRALASAADAVRDSSSNVSGLLRVTAPLELGEHLGPVLAALLARHRELAIESLLTDRVVDIIDEGFDVAIRVG